ncbi:MAG TPA: Fe-S cluster assembly protein SufD, partial [Thermopetrobacter sp.]|nr:Fe-S cluster assembly protein SufD [Thermopetrobacter sp.]
MALDERKMTATEARLAALAMPEVGCTKAAREAALERVRRMGLPGRRDEYWKYTRPDTLVQPDAPRAAVFDPGEPPMFDAFDRLRIVFVDGVFSPELSDALTLEGVEIARLEDICCEREHWAEALYGRLEARGQVPVERPLAALNTAFAGDGVVIRVTGRPSKPINLTYVHGAEDSDAFLHHLIRVEPGAEATILENGPAAARFNKCMEIDIADGGRLHLVR